MNDRERNAYAAGIIDGEGCFAVTKNFKEDKTYYRPSIHVNNTNLEILDWLQQHFGGHVRDISEHKLEYRKDIFVWKLTKISEIEAFTMVVYPFLIIKKKHAQTMLNFIMREWNADGVEYYNAFRILNKKGIRDDECSESKGLCETTP